MSLWWLARTQVTARVRQGLTAMSPGLAAGGGFAVFIGFVSVLIASRADSGLGAEQVSGLIGVSLAGVLAWAWVTAASRPAPAFTRSEIQWLITAPLSRQQLVAYRFAVTQPAVLGLVAVAAVAALPLGPLASARLALGGLLLAELALINQLLAACAQARLHAMGLRLPARTAVGLGLMAGIWALLLRGADAPPDANEDPVAALFWLAERVEAVPWLHLMAQTPVQGSFWPGALLILASMGLGTALIAAVDGPFEEHALMASRPSDQGRPLFPLARRGAVWRAIAWRGITALSRQAARAAPALIIVAGGILYAATSRSVGPPGRRELQMFSVMVVGPFFLAPTFIQQDLHEDLRRTAWLYSLPIPTADLVRGSVASGVLATWPIYALITLAGAFFVPTLPGFPPGTRLLVVPSLMVIQLACVYASFAVSNAMVLAWPTWLLHTGEESAGLENVGRLVGETALRNVLLGIVLGPSAIVGAITFFVSFRGLGLDPRIGVLLWAAVSSSLVFTYGELMVRRCVRQIELRR